MMYVERILDAVFPEICNMSVTAGCCILAVLLLRFLFRKMPRKYLYVLWIVVAFRLICPVSVNTEFSLFNLNLQKEYMFYFEKSTATDPALEEQILPEWIGNALQQGKGSQQADDKEASVEEKTDNPQVWKSLSGEFVYDMGTQKIWPAGFWNVGKYVWAAGMLVFFIYFVVCMGMLRHQVRRAVLAEKSSSVYECDALSSPFVMGIFQPRIYLPCGLQGEQRNMILLHEQCHIRRKDYLVKYLSFGLLAIYWFHPLVWAAWFGMCRDMEMSCDEKVLEILGGEHRKKYSRTLLEFAAERRTFSRMPLAFGEQDVKKRIRHTLNFRKPAVWSKAAAAAVVVLAVFFLGTNGREGRDGKPQNFAAEDLAEQEESLAEKLYEEKNPYVGDASANGRLLGVIGEGFPEALIAKISFKTELQTSEEPYEFHFRLEKEPPKPGQEKDLEDLDMVRTSVLMLALTDNLGVVRWSYLSSDGEELEGGGFIDTEAAAKWCGAEDVKNFAASAEEMQYLLDRIESLYVHP